MKTIIHFIPGLYLGGSEKVLEIIINHQVQSGNKVYVVSFEKTDFEVHYEGLVIRHCHIKYQDSLFGNKGIDIDDYETLIDELRPDYIHSHSYWTDLISHYSLRRNVVYISHFHLCYDNFDNLSIEEIFSGKLFRWLDKYKLLRRYRPANCRFIAASKYIQDFYKERFFFGLRARINCIPNPVEGKYFQVAAATQKKYDLLSVGRLEPVKDHAFLLKIVRNLKRNGYHLKLAIAGEGSQGNHLRKLAFEYGISDCVEFLGAVRDLSDIFSCSKIYIHTSKAETFGLTIFEAMAAGLPVIVRKFEGIDSRVLVDGKNALVIDGGNAGAFANAVVQLVDDPELANCIGKNGRKEALKFSSQRYLLDMDRFYKGC